MDVFKRIIIDDYDVEKGVIYIVEYSRVHEKLWFDIISCSQKLCRI